MRRLIILLALIIVLSALATAVSAQTGAVATVTAYHLNVRDYPDALAGNIIARVGRGEHYNVVARSSINHWYQLQLLDGRLGWVNGSYIWISAAHLVPTIHPGAAPVAQPVTGNSTGIVTAFHLNVRSTADPLNGAIIARVGRHESYTVTGRSAVNGWYRIQLADGRSGWVNDNYLRVENPAILPFVDGGVPTAAPTASTGRVTAFFLNIRTLPNPAIGQIIAVAVRNEVYPIVGRTSGSSWWQIQLPDGRTGWASSRYITAVNGRLAPITG